MANIQSQPGNIPVYLTNYKSYVALLTQMGTGAPEAEVCNSNDSNFLGNIVWSRNDVGEYIGTLDNAFPLSKTSIFVGTTGGFLRADRKYDDNTIWISTFNRAGDAEDEWLYSFSIEIRVYQ